VAYCIPSRVPPADEGKAPAPSTLLELRQQYRKKKDKYEFFGSPSVVPVVTAETRNITAGTLRRIVHGSLAGFVKEGWRENEQSKWPYELAIFDSAGKNFVCNIPEEPDSVVDLNEIMHKTGVCFVARWPDDKAPKRVDDKPAVHPSAKDKGRAKSSVPTVLDCFEAFSEEETLRKTEAWYCNKCKKHQCANKKMDLFMLSDILIVHLKRFSYNKLWREKLDTFVDFPLEGLDLSDFVVSETGKTNAVFDLYAVSNHYGGLSGGHYTAYCKNLINGKWYNLDDGHVSGVSPDKVKTAAAYVLFYARRKPRNVVA